MGKSEVRIGRYVDALVEVAALKRAVADEPGSDDLKRALKMAKDRASEYMRSLTGGEIGRARRMLAEIAPR